MELSRIPDSKKRIAVLALYKRLAKCGQKIPTEGAIPGFGQPGYSRPSLGGPNISLGDIRIGAKQWRAVRQSKRPL
jgi:hypothetical protein